MKKSYYSLILLVFIACGQSSTEKVNSNIIDKISSANDPKNQEGSSEKENSVDNYQEQSLDGFKKATL